MYYVALDVYNNLTYFFTYLLLQQVKNEYSSTG